MDGLAGHVADDAHLAGCAALHERGIRERKLLGHAFHFGFSVAVAADEFDAVGGFIWQGSLRWD